ncbi:ABC transporter permease [Neofamilia massiliensis]|uniref:ABC transporter permease n=1 Tax=Neofamilia massiliensis TaxID=1673724 RepID=UPI0006BB5D5A|nr:ABC transporter permease [Neofamilia massiliensis]
MNKSLTVFLYELKAGLRTKSFIITLIFIIVGLIIGSLVLNFFITKEGGPNLGAFGSEEGDQKDIGVLLIDSSLTHADLEKIFPAYKINKVKDASDLETSLQNEDLDLGLIIKNDRDLELVYNIAPAFPTDSYAIEEGLKTYFVDKDLEAYGINLKKVQELKDSYKISTSLRSLKGNNTATVPITIIISVILYMLIIINGQMAAMNVAREKNDRTMELLITSTKPSHLINGKVFASFVLSLIILLAVGLGTFAGYLINKEVIGDFLSNMSFTIDPMIIVIALLYFVLGYIMYLYIYAALGATVSSTEELSTAVAPIAMIVVFVYFGTIFALSNSDPNNVLLKVLSFVPFSSMFTMHARYALTQVPMVEVAISFGILLVTTIILSLLSVRLYRSASLNYGNRSKLTRALRRAFKKK